MAISSFPMLSRTKPVDDQGRDESGDDEVMDSLHSSPLSLFV